MTQALRKELLAQLQHLRTEAKEISRLYVANLQRDIVQLIDFVNETQNQGGETKNSRAASLQISRMKERPRWNQAEAGKAPAKGLAEDRTGSPLNEENRVLG